MQYAELYQMPIADISSPGPDALIFPPPSPQGLLHLAEVDEDGKRAEKALCEYPAGIGYIPGYNGLWECIPPGVTLCQTCKDKREVR
jgi:hypothetical protein